MTGTINLKQLSNHLRLSQTTVSRALNGYPEVSEDTRLRVMEAARLLGYKPNPSARRLATGKSGAIGYVLPVGRNVELDPHFVEFLSGLGEFALTKNIDLVLSPALADEEENAYRRIAAHNTVDAVYLSSMRNFDSRISLMQSLKFPFIAHGRTVMEGVTYPFMDIDNEGAFYDAARLLLQLGHRRIALFNGDEDYTFAVHRRRGFTRALDSFGADPALCAFRSDPMNEENGHRRTFEVFAGMPKDKRPTAVLSSSMFTTLGVVRALNQLGLNIPGDVSVICHDDVFPFFKPESFSVPLTTTRSSIRAAGSRVCELLVKASNRELPDTFSEIWPVDLVVRASTGPAPQ
jgi:LacI family transcriptional regulator